MRGRPFHKVLLAAIACLCLCWAAQAKLIDKIVATVDSEVITLSDLIRHRLILERTGRTLLETDVVLADGTLKGVLDELVMLTLVYRQAVKLNLIDYDQEELERRFTAFKNTFSGGPEFEDFIYSNGWTSEEEVFDIFRRYIIAETFVAKRVNLQVELRLNSYYDENKDKKYGDRPLSEVQDRVRQDLYNEELQTWLNELRRNAKIIILSDEL